MSQSNPSFERTFIASADYSTTGQYLIVKIAATGNPNKITTAGASTDALIGVLQDNPKSGVSGNVRHTGTTKVVAHTTIHQGDKLTAYSDGTANPTTTAKDNIIGIALEDAAAGDIFEMLLVHYTLNI